MTSGFRGEWRRGGLGYFGGGGGLVAGEFLDQELVVGVGEVGIPVEDAGGFVSGVDKYVTVGQTGHFEGREAALAGAEEVAGAAELEVDFGELKAVVVLFDGLEALGGVVGGVFGQEKAVALVGAASDASAELVELGETEAVGGFDHHNGCVGDVYADFDDGGGNEDVEVAVVEGGHDGVLLSGGQTSVEEADAEVGKDELVKSFVFLGGGLGLGEFGLFDEGEDDEGLSALSHLSSQMIIRGVAVVGFDVAGDDGGATGGHFVYGGNVEVAVEGEGEGAGDGGGGHDEDMRRGVAFAPQGGALHDAESVLFVDDGEGEVGDLHGLLDEGVGADDDVEVAVGGALLKDVSEGLTGTAGDEADGDGRALGI